MKTKAVVIVEAKEIIDLLVAAADKSVQSGAGPAKVEFFSDDGQRVSLGICEVTFHWASKIKE